MELTEGIVVKSSDYRDNDKIIYLITNNGKMSLILKSAKKVHSKTFNYSHELSKLLFGSSKNYLTTGNVLTNYAYIKTNINVLKSALIITEISYELIDHINDYKVFYSFLSDVLNMINNGINNELLEIVFRVKILYLLGVAPVFNKCVDCEAKNDLVGFSFYDGGMKCILHNNNIDYLYNNDVISQLKGLYLQKIDKINVNQHIDYQSLDSFLNRYYDTFLGFKSKVKVVFSKI
ncbi:MAG: DNA repair protein RecO [Bacilli bacterium]